MSSALIGSFYFQQIHHSPELNPFHVFESASSSRWRSEDSRCCLCYKSAGTFDSTFEPSHPVTSHCGRFTLVFKGEIFNSEQLRLGLCFQAWRGNTDCETLVEGLAQRGPALLLELRGPFAFAAYDNKKHQLLLARDRLGIQPLYLNLQKQGLLFTSAISVLPKDKQLNSNSISQILAFGRTNTSAVFTWPDTEGVLSLPAGMLIRVNHNRPPDPIRYWPPQPRPDWTPLPIRSRRKARLFLLEQLQEVVHQHLSAATTPAAFLLSSGLGSGILTALACIQQPGLISTFHVSLSGNLSAECDYARHLARHFGSDHHELLVHDDEVVLWLEEALVSLKGPTSDGIHKYLISRSVANQGIKVGFSGLGADELFGGYPSHRLISFLHLLRHFPLSLRQRLLQILSPCVARRLSDLPRWDYWHLGLAMRRITSEVDHVAAGAPPLHWPAQPPQRITQAWGQISWAVLFGYTETMALRDCDVISMACGLEMRHPFLDHQLVEIALRMPQAFHKPGKKLLREIGNDLFPSGYLNLKQPKVGIDLAMPHWMRGPLRDICLDRLEALKHSGWLDSAWVNEQWQVFETDHLHWARVWSLVILGGYALEMATPLDTFQSTRLNY